MAIAESVFSQQSCLHGYVSGNHILIQNLTQYHHPVATIHGMHVHDADVRRLYVLRTPVILRAAVDNVPA